MDVHFAIILMVSTLSLLALANFLSQPKKNKGEKWEEKLVYGVQSRRFC